MQDIRFNRERFEKGNNFYKKFKINAQSSQIRIEAELENGKGSYEFEIKKALANARKTEKVLRNTDLFVATSIGVALMIENTAFVGHSPILTYPLLKSLAIPAGYYGFTTTHAEAIYNGALSMRTVNK